MLSRLIEPAYFMYICFIEINLSTIFVSKRLFGKKLASFLVLYIERNSGHIGYI